MTDAHIHIGEFANGLCFTAEYIAEWKNQNTDIDKFLFMQTSRCGNYDSAYDTFLKDSDKLKKLVGNSAIQGLWLTLDAFKNYKKYFRKEFSALKFHPCVENNPTDFDYEYVIKISAEVNRPLIIHTSYDDYCSCSRISKICEKCPDTTVILAHGRPFDDCIDALKIPNIYADTAYMPKSKALKIITAGYGDKLLFGSDFPIDRHFYPNENPFVRYKVFKKNMQEILSPNALYNNFNRIFKV